MFLGYQDYNKKATGDLEATNPAPASVYRLNHVVAFVFRFGLRVAFFWLFVSGYLFGVILIGTPRDRDQGKQADERSSSHRIP